MNTFDPTRHPRRAKGAPGAGEWSCASHAEADDVDLDADVEEAPAMPWQYRIRGTADMEEALRRVGEANRKLERAGIEERFALEHSDPETVVHHGQLRQVWMVRLNRPSISYGGWTFAAHLRGDAGGAIIVNGSTEGSCPDVPEELVCEHCHSERHRTSTYLLTNEEGRTIQVGSSCVKAYLGIQPKGLWTLDADFLDGLDAADVDEDDEEWARRGESHAGQVSDTREVIALALMVSDGGREWIRSGGTNSTSARIRKLLEDPNGPGGRTGMHVDPDDQTVTDVLQSVRDMPDDGSEYVRNLKALVDSPVVSTSHAGLLASAVVVHARAAARKRELPAPTPGFAAPVGAKVAGMEVTVTSVLSFGGWNPYTRRQETRDMVLMRDDAGHVLKWTTSSAAVPGEGERIRLTSGSVKDHGSYRGTDQTVLTRVKAQPLDPPAAAQA